MSGRHRNIYIALRLGLLVAFFVAAFAFHEHGTTLVLLRVVSIVFLVLFFVVVRHTGRRRARQSAVADDAAGD